MKRGVVGLMVLGLVLGPAVGAWAGGAKAPKSATLTWNGGPVDSVTFLFKSTGSAKLKNTTMTFYAVNGTEFKNGAYSYPITGTAYLVGTVLCISWSGSAPSGDVGQNVNMYAEWDVTQTTANGYYCVPTGGTSPSGNITTVFNTATLTKQ